MLMKVLLVLVTRLKCTLALGLGPHKISGAFFCCCLKGTDNYNYQYTDKGIPLFID